MKTRIELIAGLLIAIILAVGISIVGSWYVGAKQNVQRGAILTNASAGIESGVKSTADQRATDAGLAAGRIKFQEAKAHANPDRAATAVPVRLRDAYAERRRARERLGCAGRECPSRR